MIHSYPWYFDDWLLSRTRMSMNSAERGIYRDVLDLCYRDGMVPDDETLLIRMLSVTAREFHAAWPAVRKHLVEVDGGLSHPRTVAELPDLQRLSEIRSNNSKNAARKRWAKSKHDRADASRNAESMRGACVTQCETDAESCLAFTIASTIATVSDAHPKIDHEAEFLSRWNRWPSKGRRRQPLCQQQWLAMFSHLDRTQAIETLDSIDRGMERWLDSKQFAKEGGRFIFGFEDFISQRRWNENPEPAVSQQDPYREVTQEENDEMLRKSREHIAALEERYRAKAN